MSWLEWFCVNALLIGALTFLWWYFANKANLWKRLGIPYSTSKSIVWNFVTGKEHFVVGSTRYYNHFQNERFYGVSTFTTTPSLTIKDPELIESILIKDFSNFHDRHPAFFADFDNTSSHLLVNLNGLGWKILRNKLTPTFTSGKLKGMMDQFLHCSDFLSKYIETHSLNKHVEITNIIQGFTIDVIASCAFGLDTQTLNEENSLFKKYGLALFRPNFWIRLVFSVEPFHKLLFILKWMPNETAKFFTNTVMDMVSYRKANNITRNDYLRLLIELHDADMKIVAEGNVDPKEHGLVDQRTLVSSSVIFLVAGFETTSTTLSYLLYELSVNQDVQEKTYRDIYDILKVHDFKITCEAINKMKYLRQAIDETLRKYPPVGNITRISNSPYRIPDSDIIIPQGTTIVVPVHCLHRDSKYFPEPDKFIPERFSEENRRNTNKMTYLPFGGGPRACIASRFAILEISIAACDILMKYKLLKCNNRNRHSNEFDPHSFTTIPKHGLWITFERR